MRTTAVPETLSERRVSRTLRLRESTDAALTRAHHERKLKKELPASLQEMADAALCEWL